MLVRVSWSAMANAPRRCTRSAGALADSPAWRAFTLSPSSSARRVQDDQQLQLGVRQRLRYVDPDVGALADGVPTRPLLADAEVLRAGSRRHSRGRGRQVFQWQARLRFFHESRDLLRRADLDQAWHGGHELRLRAARGAYAEDPARRAQAAPVAYRADVEK